MVATLILTRLFQERAKRSLEHLTVSPPPPPCPLDTGTVVTRARRESVLRCSHWGPQYGMSLKKSKPEGTYPHAIQFWVFIWRKRKHTKTHPHPLLTTASFTTAKTRKQPSVHWWMSALKRCHMHVYTNGMLLSYRKQRNPTLST